MRRVKRGNQVWISIDLSQPLKCYDLGKQFMSLRPSFVTYAAIALVLAGLLAGGLYLNSQSAMAQSALPNNAVLSGYAWSSNIGWIKMASGPGDSQSFGVSIRDGVLNGYGWSPHVGWLQFDSSLLGPSGAGVSGGTRFVSNALVGWARFCTVFASGCSGALRPGEQNGGWDGWLLLGGGNLPGGGVKLAADNKLSGYAWGSENLGWVDFSGVTVGEGFIANCSVSPTNIPIDGTATWSATASGTTGPFTYHWVLTGPQPANPNQQNITLSYPTAGTYTGQVTITDGATNKTATCQASLTVGEGGDNELEVIVEGDGIVTIVNASNETSSCGAGDPCYSFHNDGDIVTLTATHGTDVSFIGWEGDCSGSGNSPRCSLTMDADKSVTARFEEAQKFDISVRYNPGTDVMLVNYQTQELNDQHFSSPVYITATRRAGVEGPINITLNIPIGILIGFTPGGQPEPVVTDCSDRTGGPITLNLTGQTAEAQVCIYFETDGEEDDLIVSPYAGEYEFNMTASAPGSRSVVTPVGLFYFDRRESEN